MRFVSFVRKVYYFGNLNPLIMKQIMTIILLIAGSKVLAQKATISGDTAYYMSKAYYVGDTVQLGYGSGNNKIFAFVEIGSGMGGFKPLASKFSKGTVLIEKVNKSGGKITIKGKYLDADLTGLNKILIDLEGAIDNKELKE